MSRAICIMALFVSPLLLAAQQKSAALRGVNSFPESDFTLRDTQA